MEGDGVLIVNPEVKQVDHPDAVVIAVTSRAIFNMEDEHNIFLEKGIEEYTRYQIDNVEKPLKEGTAFALIKAFQMVNVKLLEQNPEEKQLFDVMLLSNNSPESGKRIINSVNHYGLAISRFYFTSEKDSTEYLPKCNVKLFLSANQVDVHNAAKRGIPSAVMFLQEVVAVTDQLRIAFDGDSVLFAGQTDHVYEKEGLYMAKVYETFMKKIPMGEGPLKKFAMLLGEIRKKFGREDSPLRTYLLTARSSRNMGIRAIKTLRHWGLEIDEAFLMNGAPKGPILNVIKPHMFFDDGLHNVEQALDIGVPAALVLRDKGKAM
ncbi:cytosolic 5'-nucleotidase 1B-like [Protopterus annectens]|uniref:cytosolic 5'-nucleotidase 1B-like n=1 Tax=Protopterus annectens TaxID=7888 RepID=UPI001CFBA93B|nr:cytosolic 5'-nucleotidase 1B-like [Protopterus annectens]